MADIKKEKSCGGVVFYHDGAQRLYLVEKMIQGHFSIPKGHVEGNETDLETALREIKEETNLEVTLVPGFVNKVSYYPHPQVLKDVYFYLFETKSTEVVPQEIEVNDIYFLPYQEAYNLLTFESDKNTLKLAHEFINGPEGGNP